MKTRNGFVSNSSSSNFVILAVDISDTMPRRKDGYFDYESFEDLEQLAERKDLSFLVIDKCAYLGSMLSSWGDDEYETHGMELNDLQDLIISTKKNIASAGYNADNLNLYYGTEYN